MARLSRLLSPSAYLDKLLRAISPTLRRYIATTPMIWGDRQNVRLGKNVQMVDVIINCRSGHVDIGDDTFFGHGVMLLTGKHDLGKRGALRHSAVAQSGRDISIGKGVWIASGTIVIGPCQIGDDSVIGAGSVVTGKVEPGALYSGNPARLVRYIAFDENDPADGDEA